MRVRQRLVRRADAISDYWLFAFIVAWVVVGGLLLQLVVLPYVIPELHWGHGLIAGLDWTSFHTLAVEQSDRIRQSGWGAWELRPNGQFPAAVASVLYLIHPEPWVVLPINGLFFALAVTAIRRGLATVFGSAGMALVAVAPFFLYLSFVPVWGQLHKDVISGAGFALVLSALMLSRRGQQRMPHVVTLAAAAAVGATLIWLSRPYGVFLVAASSVAYAVPALFARSSHRLYVSVVTLVVVLVAVSSTKPWASAPAVIWDIPPTPPPAAGTLAGAPNVSSAPPAASPTANLPGLPALPEAAPRSIWSSITSWPRTRRLDATLFPVDGSPRNYALCAPAPERQPVDRVLFFLCMTREGFKLGGEHAGSNHDYDIRLRSFEDYVAYMPRALKLATIEPWPTRWRHERSDLGRLATYLVPFEMIVAYTVFVLALISATRWLGRGDVWAIVAYCCTYAVFFAYTVPNMGTIYRMRAFAFAVLVSTAWAAFLTRSIPPPEPHTSSSW